jgi:hypothetical protein
MKETVSKLPNQETFENKVLERFESYMLKRQQSFEEQLNKLQTIEE